ncbi:MAG: hypothetical protein ACXAC7_12335, partial [Candidatus Hodarchaeales archaeon]
HYIDTETAKSELLNLFSASTSYLIEKDNGDLDCPECGTTCGFSWHADYEKDDRVLCNKCDEHYLVP